MQQFHLAIEPLPNATYALAVAQRPYPERAGTRARQPVTLARAEGLVLTSAWDLVLDTLRANRHKPALMHRDQRRPFPLSEASGVRLALLFKVLAPLSNLDRIRSIQQAIWAMSDEEVYYWFAKCHGSNDRRGPRALRILCGATE